MRNRVSKIFFPTYMAYFSVTYARKPFAIVKSKLATELGLGSDVLGWIDTGFLLFYTIGNFVYPYCTGYSLRSILLVSIFCTAAFLYLLSLCDSSMTLILVQSAHGFVQSLAWPACVAIVSPWILASERGRVMGLWGTHQTIGGMLGGLVAGYVAAVATWRSALSASGGLVFCMGVIVAGSLRSTAPPPTHSCGSSTASGPPPTPLTTPHTPHPVSGLSSAPSSPGLGALSPVVPVGATSIRSPNMPPPSSVARAASNASGSAAQPPVSIVGVLRTRGVALLCVSYFFHKMVRYGLMWWAPFYLNQVLGHSLVASAIASTALDVGGAVGGPVAGAVGDFWARGKRRTFVLSAFILVSIVGIVELLLFPSLNSASIVLCAISFFICGVSFYGADGLCTGALVQDIADRAGNPSLAGPIAAVLGGLGAAGTVLQGPLCGIVARVYGWDIVLLLLAIMCGIAGCVLLPEIMRERDAEVSGDDDSLRSGAPRVSAEGVGWPPGEVEMPLVQHGSEDRVRSPTERGVDKV